MAEPYGNYDQSNERIDPIPQPQACLDGLMRHIQAYENTIASLTQENKDLRDQLARTIQQLDILRAQAIPTQPQLMLQQNQAQNEMIEDDGQTQKKHDTSVTAMQIKPPGVLSKQTVTQQQQAGTIRHIYMHTREIVQLDAIQSLLLTGSRDGTCRIWRLDDPSNKNEPLQTLRSPGRVQAIALLRQSNAIAIATENMRVYIYNLDIIKNDLGEYAPISDLTAPLLRSPNNELFLQLGDPISSIAELGKGQILICGAGYIAQVQMDQNTFQCTSQQTFSENNLQTEPLYFSDAVTLGQYVYVIVKERFLLKNGQYISVSEQISPNQQNIQRVSARLLQVGSNMRATPFTLAALGDQGEMTPVSVFTADGKLYLLYQQWEHKMAVFDPQSNTFAHVKEGNNQFGNNQQITIMCGCAFGKQCYIVAGNQQQARVFIYELQNDQANPVKVIQIDEYVGVISRVRVEQNMLILGGLDGTITTIRI